MEQCLACSECSRALAGGFFGEREGGVTRLSCRDRFLDQADAQRGIGTDGFAAENQTLAPPIADLACERLSAAATGQQPDPPFR